MVASKTRQIAGALLFLFLALAPHGSGGVDDVPVTSVPIGRVDIPDHEWRDFISQNLEVDIERWRAKGPLRAAGVWTLLDDLYKRYGPLPGVWRVVMIWSNRLYWVQRDKVDSVGEAPELASTLHECFGRRVTRWLQSGLLQLPDVIFLLNVDDNAPRVCGPGKTCAVPPLSVGKTIDHMGPDEDILLPQLMWQSNSYHYAAWGLKKDVAFFRGNTFCSGKWVNPVPNCSVACPRNYLAWRSDRDARLDRQPRYLEAGIVEKADMWWLQDPNPLSRAAMEACNPEPLPILDRVPMAEHAKYKYLLHLEGITYSSRLNQLMLTNSLVLLQRQPFVEYFYRSLRPGVHYVPFWNVTPNATAGRLDDIYDVIDDLRRRDHADPRDLQRILAAAQDFALKFTTGSGRARYLREALTRYKSLFSDMDPYLEQFVAGLKAKGYMQPTNGTLLTNGSMDAHG